MIKMQHTTGFAYIAILPCKMPVVPLLTRLVALPGLEVSLQTITGSWLYNIASYCNVSLNQCKWGPMKKYVCVD